MTKERMKNGELNTMEEYRVLLEKEMVKMGASEQELKLIKDATIRNALKRKRRPEDVAWALLQ